MRDGATADSYLDFVDDTFKTSGHTTRQAVLAEIDATDAPGVYSLAGGLDIAAITNLPAATTQLILEYKVSGTAAGNDIDVVLLREQVYSHKEIDELYARLGLLLGTPAVHTPSSIDAGASISQTVGVVGSTVTVTRNP